MADLNPWVETFLDKVTVATGATFDSAPAQTTIQDTLKSQKDNSAAVACANILGELWEFADFPGESLEQEEFNDLVLPLIDANIKTGNIVVAGDGVLKHVSNPPASTSKAVKFSPSQKSSDNSVSPFTFRLSPIWLFAYDFVLILSLSPYAIGILWPLSTLDTWGELYPSLGNIITMMFHAILYFFTVTGFITVLVLYWLLWPMEVIVLYIATIVALCFPAYLFLNWGDKILSSKKQFFDAKAHSDEKWFFINGITVGNFWRQAAIDRLSTRFGRQVFGIQNKTHGFILDLIECFIQRDLGYQTEDIRLAYMTIRDALLDPAIKKVVVIAHSQGGIIISMALDNLLSDLPREYFQHLEIYTFAAAANHFNNPALRKGDSTAAIPYIEHYANQYDFVARFGVLEFIYNSWYPQNAFAGRLFVRPGACGHMLVQHYLDPMFTWQNNTYLDSPYTLVDLHRSHPLKADPKAVADAKAKKKMRDVSRLAGYLHGKKLNYG